jgi:N-acetylated-alpha-linked acidic dipeptidase
MALSPVEEQLLAAISADEMWRHLEALCRWDRLSGGPGEAAAVDHVLAALAAYGVDADVYTFEAYLSNPLAGAVVVDGREIRAKTRAFSAATPGEGVSGELVYVPGAADMFKDTETQRRIAALDLTGRIVLTEGGGRANMIAAQRRGAVAFIHMWPSDEPYVHEGTVSPVWGTPTPETAGLLPRIPVVQITRGDGLALKARLDRGEPVTARVWASTATGWRTVRLPVARIAGASDDFVLVGGHIDSWHVGATDNATGNVCCLEIARVLKRLQPHLRRGVRVAWWPCHSNGRYAGSAWYADHFWEELHEHCVGYVNVDSPGALGATVYDLITAVPENAAFLQGIVEELTGQRPDWERPLRAGDQSFWGPGVPSAHMLLSSRPEGQRAAVGGCGLGWWWHTEEDTLDKADRDVLLTDTRILALTTLRLATAERLPYDLAAAADAFAAEVARIGEAAAGRFDVGPVLAALAELRQAADRLAAAPAPAFNRAVMGALRHLTPAAFTVAGPFEHDAAVPAKPIPALAPAAQLAAMDPGSDGYRFLLTQLVRARNRVRQAIREATAAVRAAG